MSAISAVIWLLFAIVTTITTRRLKLKKLLQQLDLSNTCLGIREQVRSRVGHFYLPPFDCTRGANFPQKGISFLFRPQNTNDILKWKES